MSIFLCIMLWLLLDIFDHDSKAKMYADRENLLDKELWDMDRHEEIITLHNTANTINYQKLIYLEHIVKRLSEMPHKDKA